MKKTILVLMVITLISKLLGFGREVTLSYFYGATNISDAYFLSMTIPVVIFSFIGVSISTGYIPMFSKIENNRSNRESIYFTNNLINVLLVLCTFIVIIVELFTGPIVKVFASGFSGETLEIAIEFTRISIIGIYFTCVISILNGYLQIKNSFIAPAVLGFIYNLFIVSSIYASFKVNLIFLSVGSVLSLLFQLLFLLYFVKRKEYKYQLFINIKDKYIRALGKNTIPLIFGISVNQINVLVDKTIASSLIIGGISALNYADRLNSFVLSTVVMSISVTVFPMMSKSSVENKINDLKSIIVKSISIISLLLIPSTVIIMIFVTSLVDIIFARGAFGFQAIKLTSSALFFYSFGMLGIGLREILSRAFYSIQDTKTPMINAVIGMILNIILSISLSKYFGIGGIALATSIAAIVTTVLLFLSLQKKIGAFGNLKLSFTILKILLASLLTGGIVKVFYVNFASKSNQEFILVITFLIWILIYMSIIYFMKIEEVDALTYKIKRRIKRPH